MDFDENTFARMIERAGGDDCPRPEHREQLRRQVLDVFDRAQAKATRPTVFTRSLTTWRQIMRHPVSRAAAAAIFVVAMVGVVLVFHGGGTASAFADFIQPILDAKTAKCKMDYQVEGQPSQTLQVTFLAPNRVRQNLPNGVTNISDFDKGKMVSLDPKGKRMTVFSLVNMPKDKLPKNLFSQLRSQLVEAREKPDAKRESLGEKEIDGHKTVGYRISSPGLVLTIWGDPKTSVPVRVETSVELIPKAKTTWTDFQFDMAVDESLFSIEPPAGYTVVDTPVDVSPSTEEDLTATLRQYAEMTGGTFPDSFDTPSIMQFVQKLGAKLGLQQKQEPDPQQQRQMMAAMMKLNRGLMFALQQPKEADAHYAGKGVSLDAADTPIFWYRPKDAKTYRVIYADLLVREADTPPGVADAQPVPSSSGPTK
jgi:outer membrane lipoprotein-sorting protein